MKIHFSSILSFKISLFYTLSYLKMPQTTKMQKKKFIMIVRDLSSENCNFLFIISPPETKMMILSRVSHGSNISYMNFTCLIFLSS